MAEELIDLFAPQGQETLADAQTAEVENNPTKQDTETAEVADDEQEGDADTTTESSSEDAQGEIKLTPQEQFFWERLEEMASEDEFLATAMKKTDKSIRECFDYMTMLAKKKVTKQSGAQCVAVEGTEMLGWAKHYYIESKETIDAELHPKPKEQPKTASKSAEKKEEKKVHSNPLLTAIAKAQEEKNKANGSAEQSKTTTKTITKVERNGSISTTNIKTEENGERVTTINKGGQTYTMTEFSLF